MKASKFTDAQKGSSSSKQGRRACVAEIVPQGGDQSELNVHDQGGRSVSIKAWTRA